MQGQHIKNVGNLIGSHFEEGDNIYVGVDVNVDTSKHVKPLYVHPK